jgi:hypothetical protein
MSVTCQFMDAANPYPRLTLPGCGVRWILSGEGLRPRLYNGRRKGSEVVRLFGDDGLDNLQIRAGVLRDRHVTEADHALHASGEILQEDTGGVEKGECVTTVLQYAEFPPAHDIHGAINGRFAGSLQIEDNGVLLDLACKEVVLVPCAFVLTVLEASLDRGGLVLVEDDIVSHRRAHV